jgi:putative ABC transport system permease protein
MWFVTWRGLAAHKLRLALAALSVVLGVGFVAGTLVLTDTIARSVDDVRGQLSAGADVSVRSRGAEGTDAAAREPVPASVVSRVRGVEGVAVAAGSSVGFAQLVDASGKVVDGRTIGMAMPPEELGYLRLREGRAPAAPAEVAIDAATAADAGLKVGDRVTVQLAGAPVAATVVGLVGVGVSEGLPGAGIVALEPVAAGSRLRAARHVLLHRGRRCRRSEWRRPPRAGRRCPARWLEAVSGAKVGEESAADVGNALRFLPMALLAFAAISLFVGGFLIVNTFGILVRQRMREYGLLRAVGASRAQVVRAVSARRW